METSLKNTQAQIETLNERIIRYEMSRSEFMLLGDNEGIADCTAKIKEFKAEIESLKTNNTTSLNTLADRLKANNEAKAAERLNTYNKEKAACFMYLNYEGDKRRKEYKQLRDEVISWHKPFMNKLAKMLNLPTYEDCFCTEAEAEAKKMPQTIVDRYESKTTDQLNEIKERLEVIYNANDSHSADANIKLMLIDNILNDRKEPIKVSEIKDIDNKIKFCKSRRVYHAVHNNDTEYDNEVAKMNALIAEKEALTKPKKTSGIIKLSNSRKAAISLVIAKHLDLAASKHEYNAIRYKDNAEIEGAKQDDCLDLAVRFLDCYDYHSSFPTDSVISEVKTPEKIFKATIYNTDEKPNTVQAAIFEIKNLWSIGYTKKEVNYNFDNCKWNSYDFTSMNLKGTKIQDLNCYPSRILLETADLFIHNLDAKSEKALSKFEYLEAYTNRFNRRMCDRSFLYLLNKIIECAGLRIAE